MVLGPCVPHATSMLQVAMDSGARWLVDEELQAVAQYTFLCRPLSMVCLFPFFSHCSTLPYMLWLLLCEFRSTADFLFPSPSHSGSDSKYHRSLGKIRISPSFTPLLAHRLTQFEVFHSFTYNNVLLLDFSVGLLSWQFRSHGIAIKLLN